jgi:hypothetical protein
MRIVTAGLIGGLVMFVWGVFAHMVLPLGEVGMRLPVAENVVLAALPQGLGDQPGVYLLPSLDPAKMSDPEAVKAYSAKSLASPYAFVIYQPHGNDLMAMGPQIGVQWVSDTLAALALAFVMGLAGLSFGRRLGIAVAAAVFSWLSLLAPYWNWYRFPLDFTVAALIEQMLGWLLAGVAIAWWIGRQERKLAR